MTGLSPAVKAQGSATIDLMSETVYQLVDVCRVKVVYSVDPVNSPSYSGNVAVSYNDTTVIHGVFEINGRGVVNITLPENDAAIYLYHSRIVPSPSQLATPTSPFDVIHYFTLPRSAPNTEFTFSVEAGNTIRTERAYSIANSCPKGN